MLARVVAKTNPGSLKANIVCWQAAAAAPCQQNHQQVRSASRKTFALRHRYGVKPLHNLDEYENAKEADQLENLGFETIRFPTAPETNSVFYDELTDKFLRHLMRDGRRWLIDQLLHNTFNEIKMIQYKKWKKQLERKAAAEKAKSEDDQAKRSNSGVGDEEEVILDPVVIFHRAITNGMPLVTTTKIRRGGAIYQVPTPLEHSQSLWYSMKWYNDTVKDRPKPRVKHYHQVLAQELIEGSLGRGIIVKKRDDVHRLAQANKAYSHYRWS